MMRRFSFPGPKRDPNANRRISRKLDRLRNPLIIMAEGVGFEPTVGYPTLDFESSALNRTQPSLLFSIRLERRGGESPESPVRWAHLAGR